MGTNLVLIAYGRHDNRGKLFPRTKRQIDNLKAPLQQLVGDFTGEDYCVYHDGTDTGAGNGSGNRVFVQYRGM